MPISRIIEPEIRLYAVTLYFAISCDLHFSVGFMQFGSEWQIYECIILQHLRHYHAKILHNPVIFHIMLIQ